MQQQTYRSIPAMRPWSTVVGMQGQIEFDQSLEGSYTLCMDTVADPLEPILVTANPSGLFTFMWCEHRSKGACSASPVQGGGTKYREGGRTSALGADTQCHRVVDELGHVVAVELLHDILAVRLHGLPTAVELFCDLRTAETSTGDAAKHNEFGLR